MKSPNEFNIDEWLFHYFEGDLTPEDEALLEEFLLDHPQFDQDFEAWGASRIQHEAMVYPHQEKLIKPLIHPSLLHRVAVISAIGINALLAGFIIYGNKPNLQNYSHIQIKLNDNGAELSAQTLHNFENDKNTTSISRSKIEYSPNNQSELANSSQAQTKVSSANRSNSLGIFSNQNTHHTRNAARGNGESLANNTKREQIDTYHTLINGIEIQSVASLSQNKEALNKISGTEDNLSLNQMTSTEDASGQNASNKLTTLNQNKVNKETKSYDSREREGKESISREIKLGFNGNRWRKQNVLLTNTRSNEYLIPGANRNQINFGHVGSDFSNTAYYNSYAQYPGRDNQLLSNQLGYDMYIPQLKSGLGIQFMYSALGNGAVQDFETSLTYSPKIFLSKDLVFEPAVRLRMSTTGVDRNQLSPGTWVEFDRMNAFQYSQEHYDAFVSRSVQQDLGLGFLINSKWGFIGANADHLFGSMNQALHFGVADEMRRAPIFLNAVLGTEYESVNKKLLWSGQIIYQQHGMLNRIWFGSRIKYNSLSLGASVSSLGEPMFSTGYVGKGLSLLYSTDYSHSRMYNDKFFSHQLLLRVTLKESRMKKLMLN